MELPKLQKIRNPKDRPNKKKILLLSDDLRMHSGVATMSREIVMQTAHVFDWVQIGAALKHPDEGKVIDVSADVNSKLGIDHASIKIYCNSGYGDPNLLRTVMFNERPNLLLFFTDPRYWTWLILMEDEIRQQIPMVYYNIWDAPPSPFWNISTYESCDMILNISRQTHALVQNVLTHYDVPIDTKWQDKVKKTYYSKPARTFL